MKVNGSLLNKVVSVFISAMILTLSLTSYASTNVSAVNSSMAYTIFYATSDPDGNAYEAGKVVDRYTLDASPITDNSRAVIGDDDRKSHNALSGVVRINGGVTGFVVDAHTIATAAHCVFDSKNGDFNDSNSSVYLIEILDENGVVIETITNAYDVHIPNMYISCVLAESDATAYDYAMITVSQDLSDYANFNLGVATDSIIGSSLPVYVTGFPSELESEKYTALGYVMNDTNFNYERRLIYNADANSGQSGSPVYTYTKDGDDEYYTVIGIHTNSGYTKDENGQSVGVSSFGPRMTTDLLHFYKNNPYIDY